MRSTIRLLFGSELREIGACDPTLTVLDWLRLDERKTGTKEGCAEGDCGACTVVVGRLLDGRLRYEAINACIRFLPTLDGCHLLTIEHLRSPDGTLHAVQRAIVDAHGSQCGFCTPGIVMSLYALWLNGIAPSTERAEDALAGNLCRCTGYQPIVDAAQRMHDLGDQRADPVKARGEETRELLAALADTETLAIGNGNRRFYAPASVEALAELLIEHPLATIVAGATDVGLWVTKEMRDLNPIIYLGRIEALQRIEDSGDRLLFGAMVNLSEVREALARISPQLDEMLRRFGGEQVRNAGTIGGNIANGSPIGDLPPALIALGTTIVLRRGNERREQLLEKFFIDYKKQDRRPGEFVESVTVPKLAPGQLFHVSKITKRFDEDISAVCGAFLIDRDGRGDVRVARLAFGGMAGIPKRAARAEAALLGRPWTAESVEAAAVALSQDFAPLTDWRASAAYRRTVAANILRRFLIETTEPREATRVAGLLRETAHA